MTTRGNAGEMESSVPDIGFSPIHRVRERKFRKGPDLPPSAGDDGQESKYKRCKFCGFYYDSTLVSQGSGYGNISTKPLVTTNDDGSKTTETNILDVTTDGAGCPFCHASNIDT
jgi:hypothetical protein